MKILFSITYFSPYVSGLTIYVRRLASILARSHKVSVVCLKHDKILSNFEVINSVKVYRANPLFKISKGFISVDFVNSCLKLIRKTNVVIVNLPQFEGFIPSILARILGKKLIAIYHCEVQLPKGVFNQLLQKFLELSNLLSLALADVVVTYTDDFAKSSWLLAKFKDKLRYIYPPIVLPKVNKRVQNDIKVKIGSDLKGTKGLTLIGVAARLAAEKGLEYLLGAIPHLEMKLQSANWPTKFKIVVAGPMEPVGERPYKEKIMNLVDKYKDDVVFLGTLKEEDMGSFYSLIDVLVLTSINSTEAFGMVQVEAMLMGVPVVATNLPGVRLPIEKTGMGKIVPLKDSQKLAEAIVEVLINNKRYIKDKKLIADEFSIIRTINLFKQLL